MTWKKYSKFVRLLAAVLIGMGFFGRMWAQDLSPQQRTRVAQLQRLAAPSTNLPDDVQLVDADTNPTLRIPVGHSSLNWTLIKPRIRASYGWLEIDRGAVRYAMLRPSRVTKEPDQGFQVGRTAITDLKLEYGAAEFRALGQRHFFGYAPESHWDATDSPDPSVSAISKADTVYTPLILRALQSFDSVVADFKLKQQAAAHPPIVVQPAPPPTPKPVAPPPPPTLVIMAPSGAVENQTIEVTESSLTIRGVAMDDSGLPTITINGAPASLRPKGENVAEFWSDPIAFTPGANPVEIVATSPAKGTSRFHFIAHFTPKAVPANPRALGKEEIISLLQGSVPSSHVEELVRDHGIKFAPTPTDLNDVRTAGGSEDLIQTIQQAAAAAK